VFRIFIYFIYSKATVNVPFIYFSINIIILYFKAKALLLQRLFVFLLPQKLFYLLQLFYIYALKKFDPKHGAKCVFLSMLGSQHCYSPRRARVSRKGQIKKNAHAFPRFLY
jgi:hypothetical protein